ncbi:MAG TPA: hypothetical protein VGP03_08140 [Pseudonocardiaceae bacterium]|nr:hypothetical protein [Pseudonocardiaceae bacterium]
MPPADVPPADVPAADVPAAGTTAADAGAADAGAADTSATTGEDGGARTATLDLPFVRAQFRAPRVRMPRVPTPGRQELGAAAHAVRSFLPSPADVLYFGGLAALAALEVIEWPVAAAIAVGTAVAKSDRRSSDGAESDLPARRRETVAEPTG